MKSLAQYLVGKWLKVIQNNQHNITTLNIEGFKQEVADTVHHSISNSRTKIVKTKIKNDNEEIDVGAKINTIITSINVKDDHKNSKENLKIKEIKYEANDVKIKQQSLKDKEINPFLIDVISNNKSDKYKNIKNNNLITSEHVNQRIHNFKKSSPEEKLTILSNISKQSSIDFNSNSHIKQKSKLLSSQLGNNKSNYTNSRKQNFKNLSSVGMNLKLLQNYKMSSSWHFNSSSNTKKEYKPLPLPTPKPKLINSKTILEKNNYTISVPRKDMGKKRTTVKIYKSQFRSTGLEEDPPPPPIKSKLKTKKVENQLASIFLLKSGKRSLSSTSDSQSEKKLKSFHSYSKQTPRKVINLYFIINYPSITI